MPDMAIVAEGLGKRFGQVTALDGVDLDLPAGGVLKVLGPNGAGKTTMVRILATLLRPDSGRAVVAGRQVRTYSGGMRCRLDVAASLLLTTQYIEEAERLAQSVVIIDCGKVIARGILAGLSLDKVIVQLPARRRIGITAYARAAYLGNGIAFYATAGVGGAALTIAAFAVAAIAVAIGT